MMSKNISYIIPTFLILIISLIIAIITIYDLEEQVKKEYLRGYEDGEINTENQMFDDWLDFYEEYYELYVDYKVLEERLEWLSSGTVVHKFDKNYDFYLLVIVSRVRVNDDIWLYGLQEIGNSDETAYVESDELFSVGEKVIAVETSENQVILIDIS